MFANAIPADRQRQNHRNAVGIGEVANQAQQNASNASPSRRQPRLLMAPLASGSRCGKAAPAGSTPPTQGYANLPHSGSVEELFDGSNTDSLNVKCEDQLAMAELINIANARNSRNNGAVEFPEMLFQYENSHGNSLLSPELRNAMLGMIGNQASVPGSNNTMVSPTAPPQLNLGNVANTQGELDELSRLNANQAARIQEIRDAVSPTFPPSASPGLNDNNYFTALDSDHNSANLDLNQFLDTGAFYGDSGPTTDAGLDLDSYDDSVDLGMDGTNDTGHIVETNCSGVNTPEADVKELQSEGKDSSIRCRKT
jgi:heat shock transcription factor